MPIPTYSTERMPSSQDIIIDLDGAFFGGEAITDNPPKNIDQINEETARSLGEGDGIVFFPSNDVPDGDLLFANFMNTQKKEANH